MSARSDVQPDDGPRDTRRILGRASDPDDRRRRMGRDWARLGDNLNFKECATAGATPRFMDLRVQGIALEAIEEPKFAIMGNYGIDA